MTIIEKNNVLFKKVTFVDPKNDVFYEPPLTLTRPTSPCHDSTTNSIYNIDLGYAPDACPARPRATTPPLTASTIMSYKVLSHCCLYSKPYYTPQGQHSTVPGESPPPHSDIPELPRPRRRRMHPPGQAPQSIHVPRKCNNPFWDPHPHSDNIN